MNFAEDCPVMYIDRLERAVISHPYVQRMGQISQLGTIPYTKQRAAYSRLDHMIGTYRLARIVCSRIVPLSQTLPSRSRMTRYHCLVVRLSALLHDLGHLPFSHQFDQFMSSLGTKGSHEQRSAFLACCVIKESVQKDPENSVYAAKKLCHHVKCMILGEPDPEIPAYLTSIINAGSEETLDLDRIDYLPRDAAYLVGEVGSYWDEAALELLDSIVISCEGTVLMFDPLLCKQMLNLRKYLHSNYYIQSQSDNDMLFRALLKLALNEGILKILCSPVMATEEIDRVHTCLSENRVQHAISVGENEK